MPSAMNTIEIYRKNATNTVLSKNTTLTNEKNAHKGAHSSHTATASRRFMAAYVDAKADVNK